MILDVPYIPQESIEKGERKDWCALACLSMVLSYYLKENAPTLEEIHQKYAPTLEAKENFANIGIEHKDLLKIARDHGLRGFRKSWHVLPGAQPIIDRFKQDGESEADITDWEQTNIEESLFTLESMVNKGVPVVLSVTSEFSPSKSTHLVVLVGTENDQFIIHDPYQKGANYRISKEEFKKYWLKQVVIVKN